MHWATLAARHEDRFFRHVGDIVASWLVNRGIVAVKLVIHSLSIYYSLHSFFIITVDFLLPFILLKKLKIIIYFIIK
jgi:hypothetical protein